ncbi:MAG: peptidase domain-containing ABC transporter [Bernardetiaceae bacterium]|nr:peptidase domain-containing ABC transporter [Bernardetiaceae bacterium]
MDCGPTCLRMILKHYGRAYPVQRLREMTYADRQGVSLLGLSDAGEKLGFRTMAVKVNFKLLAEEAPLPCIVHWRDNHYVVVVSIRKKANKYIVKVADPALGMIDYDEEEFCRFWARDKRAGEAEGIILLLEPTAAFYEDKDDVTLERTSFTFLIKYLYPYKSYIIQLFLGLFAGSLIALVMPFLTQSLVDFGIRNRDIGFVYTILAAQLMLFMGKTAIDVLRGWIILHISARVNITIISDFLVKLMRLPIAYFDTKNLGDLLQRIRDHERIKYFLTSSSIEVIFSLFNLLVFGIVLSFYSLSLLLVFIGGSMLYVLWILIFLKRRKQIDYKRFNQLAATQNSEVQLITGLPEIKLQNCERQKRWEWERIQASLFKVSIKSLALSQYQNGGAMFINELKNIIISFFAAKEVIEGNMTLGMMLAASYIVGQLNGPIIKLLDFIQQAQDARISLERLSEIHNQKEEQENQSGEAFIIPENQNIKVRHLCFRYNNPNQDWVLNNINLEIPRGKTTAIVGSSGSGKTTLIKLLLKFYEPEQGDIRLGELPFINLDTRHWRSRCGAVMQDGFIFSDSIARNIAIGEDIIDKEKLIRAVEIANIREFIESLPLNYNTTIGSEGVGLSGGQRQRMLIARAVYKDPDFLFFDEATSSLDAKNEREITEKLEDFTKGRTMIVIAHRLSTVRNADKIVVLHRGEIVEVGTHETLVSKKGIYYDLVKNQLELGD